MEKFIQNEFVTICYKTYGNKENTPLLLVMGSCSSLVWWDIDLINLLIKDYYVIIYDLRDTGKSTTYKPKTINYDIKDLCEDINFLYDQLQIKSSLIMGFSLGGVICCNLSLLYPEKVLGLILYSTSLNNKKDLINIESIINIQESDDINELSISSLNSWIAFSKGKRSQNIEKHLEKTIFDIKRSINYHSRINHFLLPKENIDINKINHKTLIFHGDCDLVVSYEDSILLNKSLKNSFHITLEGCGHEVSSYDYDVVYNSIKNFFKN